MKKFALSCLVGLLFGTNVFAENIFPISREMGSGTRGAFVEIFGVQKQVRDRKVDATTQRAEVTNSTGVMLTTVANSKSAIGYVSLGALNSSVRALKIDGVTPSVENINNKSYKIARPFNVVIKETNPLIEDFLAYSNSLDAKSIVTKAGYISLATKRFQSTKPRGRLIIAGSSSVTPLMEKLVESYAMVNPSARIEVQQSDSTTGVNSVVEGIADIGMVSRDLRQSELAKGIKPQVLAIDGLAVIVNLQNPIENLTKDEVKRIFMGEITRWQDVR